MEDITELLKRGVSGLDIAAYITRKVDGIITDGIKVKDGLTLIATGGYGRAELAPYSDIDILMLSSDRKETGHAEEVYYRLINMGLNISQSFRTIDECREDIRHDVKTCTAMLDSRFITGDIELYRRYRDAVISSVSHREFFMGLARLSTARHAENGSSVCILEPNLKESCGGLRDVHEALWYAKAALNFTTLYDVIKILDTQDYNRLIRSFDFLLRLRICLHIASMRANDVLSHSELPKIAELLSHDEKRYRPDKLLRIYYLRAMAIRGLSRKLKDIALSGVTGIPRYRKRAKINDLFTIAKNRLAVTKAEPFGTEPWRIFEAYLLFSKTGMGFSTFLRYTVMKNLGLINKSIRSDHRAVSAFLAIFDGGRVYDTIRIMHEDGVLGRFIPEFGAITFLVISDPRHRYTVDEHSLIAIAELERLSMPDRASGNGAINRIFYSFKEKKALYLALLFHDIGKAIGSAHQTQGYKSLKYIMGRLHPDEKTREMVEFLVKNHLLMSNAAFTKDIEDGETIAEFASACGGIEYLNAILLITYADMAAVNANFLTDWKKFFLLDLYHKTANFLNGIKKDDIRQSDIPIYLRDMPQRYFSTSTSNKIIHESEMTAGLKREGFAVDITERRDSSAEITVMAWDRPGLLADIVGVFSRRQLNIVTLKTFTSSSGVIIDRTVLTNWSDVYWDGMEERIISELRVVISNKRDAGDGLKRAKPQPVISPFVELDNESHSNLTIIEIITTDSLGLLYDITSLLSDNGINIVSARITTESGIAHDYIYLDRLDAPTSYKILNETWGRIS